MKKQDMANPEAVILSTIERLDRCLEKKADPWEHSYERLGSLVVGMSDFGEENKEKILSFMAGMADSWGEKERKRLSWWEDPWGSNKEEMYRLVVGMMDPGRKERSEKMQSLVVGMAEFLVDTSNKEKLFSLLFRVACPRKRMKNDSMLDMLAGITDIFVDDAENMGRLLRGVKRNSGDYAVAIYEKGLYDVVVEMATDRVWKLDKKKLYAWLAYWVPCWRKEQKLFGLLLDVARFEEDDERGEKLTVRNYMEGARNELRWMLDFVADDDKSQRYFISDAAEMANDAHRLIEMKESDPFILLLQMFIFQDDDCIRSNANQFSEKMMLIYNWLQETKERMLEFGDEKKAAGDAGECSNYVVGLEDDISLLLHKEDIGTIIFIRGMIGIGKTTLSRESYSRAVVDGRFERCAWVVESDRMDASFESMDNESLRHMVRQQLEGKRYFIVLDDVWDQAYLKYFVKAFPQDKGSRLLLTTSNTGIRIDYQTDYNHHMQFLDDLESWKLLMITVFFGGVDHTDKKFPKELEKKGREMLRKCNGLPLAILELGRQWANKRQSGIAWEEILNEAPRFRETLMALESTYQGFGPELKSCILHLAFFKEGATIKATRMARILIVVGVDLKSYDKLFTLSEESIIQVKDMGKGSSGTVRTCAINAVFHTLSIEKAKNELSFEIIQKNGNHHPSREACHRAICCSREKFPSCSMTGDKYLVSLFFRGGGYFDVSPSYWEQFEQLKILDMEDFGLKIIPDAVGTLSELRYLGLRNNYIQELPRSLARLKKLEVLDITLNFMVYVPHIIWEMDSLPRIFVSDIICDKPLKKDALKKLGTYEKTDLSRLADLKDRRSLIFRGFRFRSCMPAMDELGILEDLTRLKLYGRLTRLSAKDLPLYVRYLTLVDSCLDEDPMPVLEKLSELFYLKLENAYTGRQMVISTRAFPELEYMDIGGLRQLRNLQVRRGAMQKLRELEIYSCPYLETLPEEILSIDSLKKLKIVTTKKIATKIRESPFPSKISQVDIQP